MLLFMERKKIWLKGTLLIYFTLASQGQSNYTTITGLTAACCKLITVDQAR